MSLLLEAARKPLLCDGAMGTQLQLAGLKPGECGEHWNLTHPERVLAIQRRYVEAGSDCLLTNTFGATPINLERHGLAGAARDINRAAVRIAREAFGEHRGFVIGDIGPFGGLMEPFGDVPQQAVLESFRVQAAALVEAGVDAIIVETQTSLEELGLGMEAAKSAGAECVIGSLAFDITARGEARTMMGVRPEPAARFLEDNGAHVAALNCGKGMDMHWAAQVVERYRAACRLPLMAQPNAGSPVIEDGRIVYRQTPEEMGAGVPGLLKAGACIIGACCGSTPAHIACLRRTLDATP